MNKNIVTILLSLLLIAGFFLPISSIGSTSALDIVKGESYGSSTEAVVMKYIWLVMPVSGVILLVGAMNNNNYLGGRSLWSILPFLAILYILIGQPLLDGVEIGDTFKSLGKGYGIGLWMMIIGSVVLAFYRPRY